MIDNFIQPAAPLLDISSDNLKAEASFYLNTTDWYVLRKLETGKDIPEDVLIKRQQARDTLSS